MSTDPGAAITRINIKILSMNKSTMGQREKIIPSQQIAEQAKDEEQISLDFDRLFWDLLLEQTETM